MENKTNKKLVTLYTLMRISLILVSCSIVVATLYFGPVKLLGIGLLMVLFITIEYRIIITSKFLKVKSERSKEVNISSVKW